MKTALSPIEARVTRPPEVLLEFHHRMLTKYVEIPRLVIYHQERIAHLTERRQHEDNVNLVNPPTEPLEDYSVGVSQFALALIGKGIKCAPPKAQVEGAAVRPSTKPTNELLALPGGL